MAAAPAAAALCLILATLLGERGLAHAPLRAAARGAHGLVRLLTGALLIGAIAAACTGLILPAAPHAATGGVGLAVGATALLGLTQRHALPMHARLWLVAMFSLLLLGVAALAAGPAGWLALGLGAALGFALALPAALALAQRFDDPELPAFMRPLPARLLAGGLAATALASLGAW